VGSVGAFVRLTAAFWRLVRADALFPREAGESLPPGVRGAAGILRWFAGPAARTGRPGERLAICLESLGPVAIKLGQFLSTRADIFGTAFAADLGRLKDRLPPFATAIAEAQVERELGRPLGTLFASFADTVAAASLAQAHAATLLDGRRVAVKVLRPDIEARVAADVACLKLAAALTETWIPKTRRLEPRAFVAVVARSLELELDLRVEAAGADELGAVMARDGYMRAPEVIWEGVGRRVLTLTWASGLPLSEAGALDLAGLDRPRLADNLVRAFLAQALDHGVFHADLHEGNLFVQAPAVVTAVDFGIVGHLGPGQRRYLAEILWGFLQRDYARVAEVHFEAGYVSRGHDSGAFAQALRGVGEPIFGRKARDVSMGHLLTQLFEVTALFEMRLRPELVLLQKTMVTVEGVARAIDPGHDIWAAAEPVVRRWMARELSPAARARDFAKDVGAVLAGLARVAREPPAPRTPPADQRTPMSAWIGFAWGVVAAAAVFAAAAWPR